MSFEQWVIEVRVSKKSLDDNLSQFRQGWHNGFDFKRNQDEKIGELQNKTAESHIKTHREILEEVNDYVGLKKNLSNRLDRVIF